MKEIEWRDLHNKWIFDKEIRVLEEKGWEGGKNKGNLETDETNTVEKK